MAWHRMHLVLSCFEVAAGKLVTVFSAPDYPQHMPEELRMGNQGAVLVLQPPHYTEYQVSVVSAWSPAMCMMWWVNRKTCHSALLL
jgi:hypothetical protein